jgi:endonuclease/exonuclease/phosphatase family metal-dependent hydrolase
MRDVILAKKGSSVRPVGEPSGANYTNMFVPTIGGLLPIPVERGWASTEVAVRGSSTGFRFVDTHLEAFGDDTIREAQAKELFAPGGPLDTDEQVILVGDLNSGLEEPHNIHGTDQLAFLALQGFGMTDNGAVQSCCYSDLFDPTQVFDHTVDHVLTKPGLVTKTAFVTGNDPAERTPSGLWPSDHGGVVSTLQLSK